MDNVEKIGECANCGEWVWRDKDHYADDRTLYCGQSCLMEGLIEYGQTVCSSKLYDDQVTAFADGFKVKGTI